MKNLKRGVIVLVFALVCNLSGFAQTDIDIKTAKTTVDSLFVAMKDKNADGIKGVFAKNARLVAIDKPKDGKGLSTSRTMTAESFSKIIVGASGVEFIERMPNKDVKIDGDFSIVSGRYTFHVGEKLSHCGTNSFNMMRTETGWKIVNVTFTLERDCDREKRMVEVPLVKASPNDVSSIDGIVAALYDVISGDVGEKREWGRDKTLYTPEIRFVTINSNKDKSTVRRITHQEYVNNSDGFLVKNGFVEREIHRVTSRFGNLAQVFSTYEWETADKKKGRGINTISLFFDGKRWWISGLSWENEHDGNPIPEKFLP